MIYGVILAGGVGKRMNNKISKQFIKINNKPVLYYSLEKFLKIKEIDKYILVINSKDKTNKIIMNIISKYNKLIHDGTISLILGGNERYDSVYNTLTYINNYFGINSKDKILFHDAARPNVDIKDIKKLIKNLNKYSAITLGSKVVDTIKEIKNNSKNDIFEIKKTHDRNLFYLIKTPQGFNLKILYDAYNKFIKKKTLVTDDIQIIEKYSNIKTYVQNSSPLNLKITTPEDLNVIKYLL